MNANCQLVFCFIIVISILSRLVLCTCIWRYMGTMKSSEGFLINGQERVYEVGSIALGGFLLCLSNLF